MGVRTWFTITSTTSENAFGATKILVILVTKEFEGHGIVTVGIVTRVTIVAQGFVGVEEGIIIFVRVVGWNIANKLCLTCVPGVYTSLHIR
jgi:hypothetical protein